MYIGRRRVGLVLVELVLVEFIEARKALIMSDIRSLRSGFFARYYCNCTNYYFVWLSMFEKYKQQTPDDPDDWGAFRQCLVGYQCAFRAIQVARLSGCGCCTEKQQNEEPDIQRP